MRDDGAGRLPVRESRFVQYNFHPRLRILPYEAKRLPAPRSTTLPTDFHTDNFPRGATYEITQEVETTFV